LNWILDEETLEIPGKIEKVNPVMLENILEEEPNVVVYFYAEDYDKKAVDILKVGLNFKSLYFLTIVWQCCKNVKQYFHILSKIDFSTYNYILSFQTKNVQSYLSNFKLHIQSIFGYLNSNSYPPNTS
jgi:hypothetical protein